ncbi:MAG: hypothetical protein PHX30_03775 [Candidatus Pacebacteria bacterium]|nr:hypothetical protein [Candidatus Paceibacterota bacterium]
MKNQDKGFSPEPKTSAPRSQAIAPQEETTLRNEFEIMQRLDFVFIKELGVNSAEEYIVEVTSLKCSMTRHHRR